MVTLVDFLDIRFGDPVLSIDMCQNGMVFGTAMGRVCYYNLKTY